MNDKSAFEPPRSPSILPSSPEAMATLRSFGRPAFAGFAPSRSPARARPVHAEPEEDSSEYPRLSVIVIGTKGPKGKEFRVGLVKSTDFEEGLRLPSGDLNPTVALRCFGQSPVYDERKAEEAARGLYERTLQELTHTAVGSRLKRTERAPDDREVLHDQAFVEACKKVCGIKVLHHNCTWPAAA